MIATIEAFTKDRKDAFSKIFTTFSANIGRRGNSTLGSFPLSQVPRTRFNLGEAVPVFRFPLIIERHWMALLRKPGSVIWAG